MNVINLKLSDIKENLPIDILDEIKKVAFENVNSYPQNYNSLIEKLAQKHSLEAKYIKLINGVDEGIELVCRLFGQNALIFPPTYYDYLDVFKRNNIKYSLINSFNGSEYIINYEKSDIEKRTLIYLCNPNNPFGAISKSKILEIADNTQGVVVVDETYIDFNGESVINEFINHPNLLVLRSFSKGYSAAGLRIGYIVGSEELVEKIENIKQYFNVSSVSVNAAKVLLDKAEFFQDRIKKIKKRKDDFEAFLKDKGFFVIHTMNNNIIIKFPAKKKADALFAYLKKKNIIVNQGNGVSTCGLDDTFIRFACGTEGQMKKVIEIIERYPMI